MLMSLLSPQHQKQPSSSLPISHSFHPVADAYKKQERLSTVNLVTACTAQSSTCIAANAHSSVAVLNASSLPSPQLNHVASSSENEHKEKVMPTIQPGMVTPLPPGLTPDMLAMLIGLPESDLSKLNLPPALLTAIRVWKRKRTDSNPSGQPIQVHMYTK